MLAEKSIRYTLLVWGILLESWELRFYFYLWIFNWIPLLYTHDNHYDINPTVHILMQIQMQYKSGLCCSGPNGLLVSDFGSSTRGERHNSFYSNPNYADARRIMWCVRSLSVEICKTPTTCLNDIELNSLCPNGRELSYLPQWSNVNFQLTLFQNPQIIRTISSGHDAIHIPAPFPVWGLIMTMVIVISFACKRKTLPNDCASELKAV